MEEVRGTVNAEIRRSEVSASDALQERGGCSGSRATSAASGLRLHPYIGSTASGSRAAIASGTACSQQANGLRLQPSTESRSRTNGRRDQLGRAKQHQQQTQLVPICGRSMCGTCGASHILFFNCVCISSPARSCAECMLKYVHMHIPMALDTTSSNQWFILFVSVALFRVL